MHIFQPKLHSFRLHAVVFLGLGNIAFRVQKGKKGIFFLEWKSEVREGGPPARVREASSHAPAASCALSGTLPPRHGYYGPGTSHAAKIASLFELVWPLPYPYPSECLKLAAYPVVQTSQQDLVEFQRKKPIPNAPPRPDGGGQPAVHERPARVPQRGAGGARRPFPAARSSELRTAGSQ